MNHRKTCSGTDEDCLKALFLHQLINGNRLTDDHVCLDLNAQSFYILDFRLHTTALSGDGTPEYRRLERRPALCSASKIVTS